MPLLLISIKTDPCTHWRRHRGGRVPPNYQIGGIVPPYHTRIRNENIKMRLPIFFSNPNQRNKVAEIREVFIFEGMGGRKVLELPCKMRRRECGHIICMARLQLLSRPWYTVLKALWQGLTQSEQREGVACASSLYKFTAESRHLA